MSASDISQLENLDRGDAAGGVTVDMKYRTSKWGLSVLAVCALVQ